MDINPYKEELNHPLWLDKMEEILKRDEYKCVLCGFPIKDKRRYRFWDNRERELQVHFRQYLFDMKSNKYVKPWRYDDELLITVDSWCREKGNRLFKIPIRKIN
jgi:hypothetical protein